MPLCVRLSGVEEMSDVCVCGKCLCVSVGSDCLAWRAPTPKSLDGDPVTVFIRLCSLGLWPLCVCVSDKKAFFVINTSDAGPQIYELVAQTQDARKTWVSQPVVCFLSSSPCLSAHKRVSVCLLSCLLSVRLLENMGLSVCCPVFSVCSLWLFSVTVCIYLTEKMDMLPHHSYVIHVKQVICVHDTMPHMCVCVTMLHVTMFHITMLHDDVCVWQQCDDGELHRWCRLINEKADEHKKLLAMAQMSHNTQSTPGPMPDEVTEVRSRIMRKSQWVTSSGCPAVCSLSSYV